MKKSKSPVPSLAALYRDRELYRTLDSMLSLAEKTALLSLGENYPAYRKRLLELSRKYNIEIPSVK